MWLNRYFGFLKMIVRCELSFKTSTHIKPPKNHSLTQPQKPTTPALSERPSFSIFDQI